MQGETCGREGEHASLSVLSFPPPLLRVVGAMASLPSLSGFAASEEGLG